MKKSFILFFPILVLASIAFSQTSQKAPTSPLPYHKFSPPLLQMEYVFSSSSNHTFLLKGRTWVELENKLHTISEQITVLQTYPATAAVLIETDGKTAGLLSKWSEISFIDIHNDLPQAELLLDNFDLNTNQVIYLQSKFSELDGQGMNICIKENRYDSVDIDLIGRYFLSPNSAPGIATHATTMATIIAGAGNSFYTGKGVAPKAAHTSTSFFNILPEPQDYFNQFNISVQNHSYGIDIQSYYGAEAEAYDQLVFQNGQLIHVFSIGNSGLLETDEGQYAEITGFANITGNFKMAKNILTVGAVDSFLQVESLSSRGPAYDGRVKPELVAFGPDGSSGSAAITSGVSLLIQQAYQQIYDSLPPAELVKAALFNGAKDLLTIGPDYSSGYGSVQAHQSVESIKEGNYLLGEIEAGETSVIPLEIPEGAESLKITLAWLDPPAAPNAEKALINDLDLTVTLLDSAKTWLPWTLNAFPHPDSLSLPAVRKRDTLNPQEQISLKNLSPGTYSIEVHGQSMVSKQRFAVVYDWEMADKFSWIHPFKGDNFVAQQKNIIRWESSFGNIQGKIEYRFSNQSANWEVLNENVSLLTEYQSWEVPDIFSAAQLRMIVANDTFYSDEFIVSRPLTMNLELDCNDLRLLSWEHTEKAIAYQVWSFSDSQLTAVSQTTDSFFIVSEMTNLLAVQPIMSDSLAGLRAPLLNLDFQRAGCYIQSFFVREIDNQAEIELEIGSWYGVKEVSIEKQNDGNFISLVDFTTPGQLSYTYQDQNLIQGAQTYRAVVELDDGSMIYSDEQTIIYAAPSTLYLYPNPAYEGEDVFLQTKNLEGSTFLLYDQMGRVAFRQSIDVETELVFTDLLSEGLYHYVIRKNGIAVLSGKLVVQ